MTLVTENRDAPALPDPGLSLARSSGLIVGLSVITLVLGFSVQMALAARLGTSAAMDAYLVAITLPALGATVAQGAFSSALVPALRGRLAVGEVSQANGAFRLALAVSAVAGLVVAVAVSWGAQLVVAVIAPGLDAPSATMAAGVLRIAAFGLAFDLPRGVLTARQYALDRYVAPQAAPSLNHLILLAAAILLLPRLGLPAMAAAWTVGSAAMLAVLLPGALRSIKQAGSPRAGWASLRLLPAALAMAALTQATPIVDRWVASSLPAGAIAALGYGSKLLEVMMRTLPMGVVLALFPVLSHHAARQSWPAFRGVLERGLRSVILGILPLTILLVLLREPLIQVLLERGEFDRRSTVLVADAVFWYGISLLPAGIAYALGPALLAIGETRVLARNSAWFLVGTVVMDLGLASLWGYNGIAIAFCALSLGLAVTLAYQLSRRGLHPSWASLFGWLTRVLAAGALMAASTWAMSAAGWIDLVGARMLGLIVVAAMATVLYVSVLRVLRVTEIRSVLELARWDFVKRGS